MDPLPDPITLTNPLIVPTEPHLPITDPLILHTDPLIPDSTSRKRKYEGEELKEDSKRLRNDPISDNKTIFTYDSGAGNTVEIPQTFNPYSILHLTSQCTFDDIKDAFRKLIQNPSRQQRALISLAYDVVTSPKAMHYKRIGDEVTILEMNDHVKAAVGAPISKLNEIEVDDSKRSILYKAARSGFYDVCESILKLGGAFLVDQKQSTESTPLHAASYYGHDLVVALLLDYGADTKIKNKWGNSAYDEARTYQIKNVLLSCKDDIIGKLIFTCPFGKLAIIKYKDRVVAKRIIKTDAIIEEKWEQAWHGTKFGALTSIYKTGLHPAGSQLANGQTLKPPTHHYALGQSYLGIPNWAAAVFTSPALSYAADPCYSERILSEGKQWCCLVEVKVCPGSYTSHQSTTSGTWIPTPGEPNIPEWRIPSEPNAIQRVAKSNSIMVRGLTFIKVDFFEDMLALGYGETMKLLTT